MVDSTGQLVEHQGDDVVAGDEEALCVDLDRHRRRVVALPDHVERRRQVTVVRRALRIGGAPVGEVAGRPIGIRQQGPPGCRR